MNVNDLKAGYKVRINGHRLNWFVDDAELTYIGGYDTNIGRFSGPAREDNVGGQNVTKGELVEGYAIYEDVQLVNNLFEEVEVVAFETTIRIPRKLTPDEKDKIRAIVGV